MNVLSDDIGQLVQFRNTYRQNEDLLTAERKRFHNLDQELKRVREEGVRDVEALQKRIQDNFEKQIDEYHKKAQSDAERNISEIERNIQLQNNLLEGHADLQEDEIDHTDKIAQKLASENEQYNADLRQKQEAVEEFARKQYE